MTRRRPGWALLPAGGFPSPLAAFLVSAGAPIAVMAAAEGAG